MEILVQNPALYLKLHPCKWADITFLDNLISKYTQLNSAYYPKVLCKKLSSHKINCKRRAWVHKFSLCTKGYNMLNRHRFLYIFNVSTVCGNIN